MKRLDLQKHCGSIATRLDGWLRKGRRLGTALLILGILSLLGWGLVSTITRGWNPKAVQFLERVAPTWADGFVTELANGFWYPVNNSDMPTVAFLGFQVALWAVYLATVFLLLRYRSDRRVLGIVLGFALLFRLALMFSVPIHENDYYRYLWDGKCFTAGVNPYLNEPAALYLYEFKVTQPHEDPQTGMVLQGRTWSPEDEVRLRKLIELRDENPDLYFRIGHWQIPTIYPPVAQLVFGASHLLFGDSLAGLRVTLLLFDLGCLALILGLLRLTGRQLGWSVIYAWSPLILVELTNSAHYDAVPVFFMLLGIWLALQSRLVGALGAMVGTGLSKFFGMIMLPVLYPPQRPRHWLYYLICASTMGMAFLPFVLWQGAGVQQVFGGLSTYTEVWQNNSGLFLVLNGVMDLLIPAARDSYLPAKAVMGLIYLGFMWCVLKQPGSSPEEVLRKCFWAIAGFFILSPTAFPWYFAWVAPFLCLYPRLSWLVLMPLLSLYYLDFHEEYRIADWKFLGIPVLNWMIWAPFGLLWLLETYRIRIRPGGVSLQKRGRSLPVCVQLHDAVGKSGPRNSSQPSAEPS